MIFSKDKEPSCIEGTHGCMAPHGDIVDHPYLEWSQWQWTIPIRDERIHIQFQSAGDILLLGILNTNKDIQSWTFFWRLDESELYPLTSWNPDEIQKHNYTWRNVTIMQDRESRIGQRNDSEWKQFTTNLGMCPTGTLIPKRGWCYEPCWSTYKIDALFQGEWTPWAPYVRLLIHMF